MAESKNSPWNSLEVAKLIVGSLMPIATAYLGFLITSYFREADNARADAILKAQQLQVQIARETSKRNSAQNAVAALSKYIYDRRVRAELLAYGLRRYATNKTSELHREIVERKAMYDKSYADWNGNHQSNLFQIRQILQSESYSDFEGLIEFDLVGNIFAPLDKCLTAAYDIALRGGDPRPELDRCKASSLIQRALDCGYIITDELFRLSSNNKTLPISRQRIEDRCSDE